MRDTALLPRKAPARPAKANYIEKVKKQEQALEDTETPRLRRRLLYSVVLLLALMYFSMGVTMWG